MPYSAENKDVHDSAYEAACDTLLAYAPQIAHTHGFEMLATNAPKGILNDSIGLTSAKVTQNCWTCVNRDQ